jgi:hypothetical protein
MHITISLYYPRRVFLNFLWLLLSAAITLSVNNINLLANVMEIQFLLWGRNRIFKIFWWVSAFGTAVLPLIRCFSIKAKQTLYSPGQALRVPGDWGSQIFRQSAHKSGNVVNPMHRPPLPPWNIHGTYVFMLKDGSTLGHSAAGRIKSIKNSNDTIGNRTHDLPACSTLPPTNVVVAVIRSHVFSNSDSTVYCIQP